MAAAAITFTCGVRRYPVRC
jgi:hypothetical protein